MTKRYFVTGTDTDVGKSYVSAELLKYFCSLGLRALGIKPIASGALVNRPNRNGDAVLLQQQSNVQLPYEMHNPFLFAPAIAPHIAAEQVGITLTVASTITACQPALQYPDCDVVLIEGCGGWLVPLNDKETFADLAAAFNAEIILVVGMRVGCLNHSLLTMDAIQSSGLEVAGWIANFIDPQMPYREENIKTLCDWLAAPFLGRVEFNKSFYVENNFIELENAARNLISD